MPDGLDIDHKSPLSGVMAGYSEQVLVCTGVDDWTSKIEEENAGDNLAADLKELFGRGGTYSDVSDVYTGSSGINADRQPFHNISVLNSSFPHTPPPRQGVQSTSAYLLPSFKIRPAAASRVV